MASPWTQNGALPEATDFAALSMNRYISGLITQASALSDAAVPYLQEKFYSASRYDRLIDGLNIELSSRMTPVRPPGSSIYNGATFPGINSLSKWKFIQNGGEIIRVLADGDDGKIYDATAGQKSTLLAKSAGAGAARMLAVNTELFIGDGVDQKKVLRSAKTWQADTKYNISDFIIDSNGNIQSIQANPVPYTITRTRVVQAAVGQAGAGAYLVVTFSAPVAPTIPSNQTATFSGLTTEVWLNGQTLQWIGISAANLAALQLGINEIAFPTGHSTYGPTADTGTMVALVAEPGTSGGVQPAWSAILGAITSDSGVNWRCFGPAVENWGVSSATDGTTANATSAPFVSTAASGISYWRAGQGFFGGLSAPIAILDENGSVQVFIVPGAGTFQNGLLEPIWATIQGATTLSGTVPYVNYGKISPWYAGANYGGSGGVGLSNPAIIVDPNGNLQALQDITTPQTSGATAPAWANAIGATTADGTVTWVNVGAGSVLWSGKVQYAWSPHCIDGTVGNASPILAVPNGGLGVNGSYSLELIGPNNLDPQCDYIYIWRTAQGQSTLILLDIIPNPGVGTNQFWSYWDVLSDLDLNAFIAAPIASAANPPPLGALPLAYAYQRVWYALDNLLYYTAGPDATTGNGLTQCPPLNFVAFTGKVYQVVPVTVQNGGLIVFTSSGIQIVLGTGTASNPFYATTYYRSVNVVNFNAVSLFNTTMFVMEATGKVSAIAVEYPFNPATGYSEVGQPIGDQFLKVTTGGISAPLYDPKTAYVTWNSQDTAENALYVADGTVGWFRMGFLSYPESGAIWSPRRAIAGGTSAVQSIETIPGVNQLLIGPPTGTPGPILVRDANTNADNGVNFDAPYATIGGLVLAAPGEVAEIAFVTLDSIKVGTAPTIAMLFGEIAATTNAPFKPYTSTTADPPLVKRQPQTVFAQRFEMLQGKQTPKCRYLQMKIQWTAENAPSELLAHAIYGAKKSERRQQP